MASAIALGTPYVYSANYYEDSVSVTNMYTQKQEFSVPVGSFPSALIPVRVFGTPYVYCVNSDEEGTISVINANIVPFEPEKGFNRYNSCRKIPYWFNFSGVRRNFLCLLL